MGRSMYADEFKMEAAKQVTERRLRRVLGDLDWHTQRKRGRGAVRVFLRG